MEENSKERENNAPKSTETSMYSKIKDEELFYAWVRWIILIVGLLTLAVLVFAPAMIYLLKPDGGSMSRLISMVINAMTVGSLLLALYSLREARSSNKDIHDVTDKLEKFSRQQERDVDHTIEVIQAVANQLGELAVCQEENINQTMNKLEELGRTQENIHTMLKNNSTVAGSRILPYRQEPLIIWQRDSSSKPGTADPAEVPEAADPPETT